MGVISESMVEYAQPLLDETDGSQKQMQSAISIAQMCWNIALLPQSKQEDALASFRSALNMEDDAEFEDFKQSVVEPMILRHHKMFPNMSRINSQSIPAANPGKRKYPGTGRNEPCPCNSGKKYKWCCGR